MRQSVFILLLLVAFSWSQSCSNSLSIGTFNTLQIEFAPYKAQRLSATANYLANQNKDLQFLCLQEIWQSSDRSTLISDLQAQYPYNYYAPQNNQGTCTGGCTSDEISEIKNCLNIGSCLNIFDGNVFNDCLDNNCRQQLDSVSSQCSSCLFSGQSTQQVFNNLGNCLSNDNNNQTCYAFGGQSDSIIFSRTPLFNTDFLLYTETPITYTTALYAQTNTSLGTVNIFCTHLLPEDLPIMNNEQSVNLNQTEQLLSWVNQKVNGSSSPIFVMGDFNHGPGFWESNYNQVINNGYSSAYITLGNNNCTYCHSNPLAVSSGSYIIDHIYHRNVLAVSSDRFVTYYQVNIPNPSNSNRHITLSDHYGVRATFCPGSSQQGVQAGSVTVIDNDTFRGNNNSGARELVPVLLILVALVTLIF